MTDREAAGRGPAAPSVAAEGPSFEGALERLEEIVRRLDEGDLALEAALAAFEEGVALARQCSERLEQAERRIALLVRDADGPATRPFEPPAEGA
jgi:exodeoxyribonuclease VII small subunit